MNFLLENFISLSNDELRGINGGCSGTPTGTTSTGSTSSVTTGTPTTSSTNSGISGSCSGSGSSGSSGSSGGSSGSGGSGGSGGTTGNNYNTGSSEATDKKDGSSSAPTIPGGSGNCNGDFAQDVINKKNMEDRKNDILDRVQYDPDLQKYVKENTVIEIERNPNDNGKNGKYYQSTIRIKVGDVVIDEYNVQSTADGSSKEPGQTLPPGTYRGDLLDKSTKYEEAIHLVNKALGAGQDDAYLIHPNAFTGEGKNSIYGNRPCSEGCQIMNLSEFNVMTSTMKSLGFDYGGTRIRESYNVGDSVPVIIK